MGTGRFAEKLGIDFGGLILIVTLCFVDDPLKALKECFYVLKNKGAIVLGIVPRESRWGRFYLKKKKDGHPFYSVAHCITKINHKKSYIAIPTRPPAEKWVKPAIEDVITKTYQIFTDRSIQTEYLIGYEGDAFASTGNLEHDLLSITSVHPMREEAVKKILQKAGDNWRTIERLKNEDKLMEVKFKGHKFYMRKLSKKV